MGEIVRLSPRPRRAAREAGECRVILFTGVWRERYDEEPPTATRPRGNRRAGGKAQRRRRA